MAPQMKNLPVALLLALIAAASSVQAQDEHLANLKVSNVPSLSDVVLPPESFLVSTIDTDRSAPNFLSTETTDPSLSFEPSSAADVVPADSSAAYSRPIVIARETPQSGVQWKALVREASLYVSVMHGFRIATEPETRAGLHNSVLGGYFKAVGSLHGWSDGDGYYENYLGHPIQGAVSGYLWVHNDPRYRRVEFGASRDYWMSRLRAYAFAWAFSEQFEIGPISEASIGQIQRYCKVHHPDRCGVGLVDHVITPNAGIGMMIGMDAVDRYVTQEIENRTRNVTIRRIARVASNPAQSFANLVAFEAPWHRENRPGVHFYDGEGYAAIRPARDQENRSGLPEVPRFELTAAAPSFLRFGSLSCVGGGGIGAFRLTDSWQWTVHVDGCAVLRGLPHNWHGDALTFGTGPQWIAHANGRFNPHVHMRVGTQKLTEQDGSESSLQGQKNSHVLPLKPENEFETTGFSLSVGGGMHIKLNRALGVQLANLEYVRSWLGNLSGISLKQGFRLSTGLVLRVGTW